MLRKVELESSRLTSTTSVSTQPPPFRVDAAVKLIPKFTEHDVETFLISFEKIAELNAFPPDKYSRHTLLVRLSKYLLSCQLRNVTTITLLRWHFLMLTQWCLRCTESVFEI